MSSKVAVLFVMVGFIAIVVAFSALSTAGVNVSLFSSSPKIQEVNTQLVTVPPVSSRDHVRGAEDPQIIWIEYSDLECPFCSRFHPVMKQVIDVYGDQVQWVYRHFPLEGSHPGAYVKSQAAECVATLAGEEAFWTYIDGIFTVGPDFEVGDLTGFATQLGVDRNAFETCVTTGQTNARIDEDFAGGLTSGVTGTPTSYIIDPNGVVSQLPGVPDFTQMTLIIEAVLAEANNVQ